MNIKNILEITRKQNRWFCFANEFSRNCPSLVCSSFMSAGVCCPMTHNYCGRTLLNNSGRGPSNISATFLYARKETPRYWQNAVQLSFRQRVWKNGNRSVPISLFRKAAQHRSLFSSRQKFSENKMNFRTDRVILIDAGGWNNQIDW